MQHHDMEGERAHLILPGDLVYYTSDRNLLLQARRAPRLDQMTPFIYDDDCGSPRLPWYVGCMTLMLCVNIHGDDALCIVPGDGLGWFATGVLKRITT